MPKTKGEETRKHGDPLEPLIDDTQRGSSPRERGPEEDPEESQDDDVT